MGCPKVVQDIPVRTSVIFLSQKMLELMKHDKGFWILFVRAMGWHDYIYNLGRFLACLVEDGW